MPYIDEKKYPGLFKLWKDRPKNKLSKPRASYTDPERYPGLSRLRGGLRSRSRTEMPRPEARVPNRKVVPKIPPFATKAGLSINMPQSSKTGETSPGAEARKTLGWGGQKFAGNMTTDQFVSLAGALGHAIAPNTPQGRVGSVMSQFGQQEMLRRRGMTEALRKEGIEREKLHTKTLIDVGAEERKRESDIATAGTLAGAKVTAAETLTRTKADAERIKAAAEKLKEKESIRQFGVKEQRLRKEKDEKGLTASQQLNYRQDRFSFVEEDTEKLTEFKDEYTPLQIEIGQNVSANKYDAANLPEDEAQENIRKRAVRSGKDETGQKVYANAYGEQFIDKACTKPYIEGKDDILHADGTKKGAGFLGTLKRPDGSVSTEISIGVNIDGKEVEIPSLVPTLTKTEINHLLDGKKPTQAIVDKATKHAKKRIAQGKSPFYQKDEKTTSKMSESELRKALYGITGKREDLYPPTRKLLKSLKEAGQKIGRGLIGLGNMPVKIEDLPRYSRRKLR